MSDNRAPDRAWADEQYDRAESWRSVEADDSLRIYNIEQRTEEWHDLRRGLITASAIGQLITAKTLQPANNDTSRAVITTLAGERITDHTEDTFISDAMWRGIIEEPYAVDMYADVKGVTVESCGFMTRELDGGAVIGFSPDGLVGDDGFIEVKSRAPKKHIETVLAGEVPAENVAQIQTGFFVSGRKWCDYISFSSAMAFYTIRVYPDPRWQAAIAETVDKAEAQIVAKVAAYKRATEGLPVAQRVERELEMRIA